jgi:putative transposase
MKYSASEKYEIVQLVQHSDLSLKRTMARLDIHKSTYYNWLGCYHDGGLDALEDKKPQASLAWNQVPADHREVLIDFALRETDLSPRELAVRYTDEQSYFVSESTVYRLLKAQHLITSLAHILMNVGDKFQQPNRRVNELWQTDCTNVKIIGWGWYYLSTVLDDYSRFILAWRLCTTVSASDLSDTFDYVLAFTELNQVNVQHRPRLLSDNFPCYISGELADYLTENGINHTRGRPYHPQTQGKIDRWHRSMKNQILLNDYYLPSELEEQLHRFVSYYNQNRYHESIDNLTPADVYYVKGEAILMLRERIKLTTIILWRKNHYDG